jgi:predicted ATPase
VTAGGTQVAAPASARFRLFESVTALLANAATRPPLLIVLDDLHCADTPSMLLLKFVMREPHHAPSLVVGTHRDVAVAPAPLGASSWIVRPEGVAEALAEDRTVRRRRLANPSRHHLTVCPLCNRDIPHLPRARSR